jgi:hypothetical protein
MREGYVKGLGVQGMHIRRELFNLGCVGRLGRDLDSGESEKKKVKKK